MPSILEGDLIPLNLQLFDGATNKHVQVRLFDADGTELGDSPVALSHTAGGLYQDDSVEMPASPIIAQYKVYDDSGFTTPSSAHADATDLFDVRNETEVTVNAPAMEQELSGTMETDFELIGQLTTEEITATLEEC